MRNIPAALYKAMGGFATNGVNMTKLESYMLDGQFTATQFYADIEGHPEDPPVARALEELALFHHHGCRSSGSIRATASAGRRGPARTDAVRGCSAGDPPSGARPGPSPGAPAGGQEGDDIPDSHRGAPAPPQGLTHSVPCDMQARNWGYLLG